MSLIQKISQRYRAMEARAAGRDVRTERVVRRFADLTPARERELVDRIAELEDSRVAAPDVTVIIAAYNVGDYLEASVHSVLNQTLRNLEVLIVDDHSTDGTLELAVELSEEDTRVRVLRTPENSGGPGVPRNIGIRSARAEYFTFLDGDDTLETHACKNLLDTAARTGSDLVVGRTHRFHVQTGRAYPWYGHLFAERRESILAADMPELLDDSIAAGKLYRRSYTMSAENWLLEGVHYEDLVFTARAYAEARSVSIIPTTTYFWHVYPEDERKSITAQKDDLDNLVHRLNALDLVDEALAGTAGAALLDQVKRKFLRHDARIYLNQAPRADSDWLESVCELISPRLESYSAADWDLIDVYARIVYGCVLTRNVEGIRQSVLFSIDGGVIAGRTVTSDGRRFWQPTGSAVSIPEPESTAARLLDLTDDSILSTPPRGVKPHHRLTDLRVVGDMVLLEGRTDDLGGWFDDASIEIDIKLRKSPDRVTTEAQRIANDGLGGIRWRARWAVPRDFSAQRPQIWDLRVVLRGDGYRLSSLIDTSRFDMSGVDPVQVRTTAGRAFDRSYRFYSTAKDHLALQLQGAAGTLRLADRITGAAAKRASTAQRGLRRRIDKAALGLAYARMRSLPLNDTAVFCESMLGRSVWDSPRAVADAVRAIDPSLTVYWVHAGAVPELPAGFVPVRRWSIDYLRLAATARYIIDNQTLPTFFRKRDGQRYLQTWHGIPLKRMGLDAPEFKFAPPEKQEELLARAAQWDGLVSPCGFFEETFVRAYRYEGELLRGGTPRNDELVRSAALRDEYKRKLGLPLDRPVVLYAPTFRASASPVLKPGEAFDVRAWAEEMGDSAYLLVRAHYLDKVHVPRALHHCALNVSDVPNVNDLYLAADILITDYSSVMFDYAVLRRPMVFYTYDLDEYTAADRGTYFDLTEEAPGAVVRTFDDLVDAVRDVLDHQQTDHPRVERFLERYCGDEDGTAADRAARWLLTDAAATAGAQGRTGA